jgi:hypothetical protein
VTESRAALAQQAVVPETGLLSGGGATNVHGFVYHHPTPQSAPDSFATVVDPIPGDDGRVLDWRLSHAKLLARRADDVQDMWSAFAAWRSAYVLDRLLGDVALVKSFLLWADHVTDVTALHALNLPQARIDSKVAPRLVWQLNEAQTALRTRGEMGLGISVPEHKGLVRGFVLTQEPLLLLADRGTEVRAVRTGLELIDPSTPSLPPRLLVHGWVVAEAGGVTAKTDDGPVQLGNSRGGRLLASVAPGIAQASVGATTLMSVFSGFCLALREVAQLAATDREPLWIRRGEPH